MLWGVRLLSSLPAFCPIVLSLETQYIGFEVTPCTDILFSNWIDFLTGVLEDTFAVGFTRPCWSLTVGSLHRLLIRRLKNDTFPFHRMLSLLAPYSFSRQGLGIPNLIGTGEFPGLYEFLSCHVDSVSPCFGVSGLTTFPVALRLTLLTGIGSRQVMTLGLAFFCLASRPCVYIVRFTMLSEGGILPLGVRSMDLLRLFDVNCGGLVFKGASITLP